MQKAPRQVPEVSTLPTGAGEKGGASMDLIAGLVSVTMTCLVSFVAGLSASLDGAP